MHKRMPKDTREEGIANLKELAEIRNTIAHGTVHNGVIENGETAIPPHITKNTAKSTREETAIRFNEETYNCAKRMIGKGHLFLEKCNKAVFHLKPTNPEEEKE